MPTTWITITQPSGAGWISLTQAVDEWIDPRLTMLLTESGVPLLAENGHFLCIETMAPGPQSPWGPL